MMTIQEIVKESIAQELGAWHGHIRLSRIEKAAILTKAREYLEDFITSTLPDEEKIVFCRRIVAAVIDSDNFAMA